jgi:hypothetical protein
VYEFGYALFRLKGGLPSEPRQAWRKYAIVTALLVWALYALVTRAFGLFG